MKTIFFLAITMAIQFILPGCCGTKAVGDKARILNTLMTYFMQGGSKIKLVAFVHNSITQTRLAYS